MSRASPCLGISPELSGPGNPPQPQPPSSPPCCRWRREEPLTPSLAGPMPCPSLANASGQEGRFCLWWPGEHRRTPSTNWVAYAHDPSQAQVGAREQAVSQGCFSVLVWTPSWSRKHPGRGQGWAGAQGPASRTGVRPPP